MMFKRGLPGWNRELSSVIVGVDPATQEVCRIFVQKDGLMVQGTRTHFPHERPAIDDALVVFGMTHAHEFMAADLEKAAQYGEELMQSVVPDH